MSEFSIPLMNIKHCDNEKKKHKFYFMKLEVKENNEHKIETQKSF